MNHPKRLKDLIHRWSQVDANVSIGRISQSSSVLVRTPEGVLDLDYTLRWTNLALIQAQVTDSIRYRGLRGTLEYDGTGYHVTVKTPNNEYCNNAYDELAAIALLSAYVPFLEAIALIPPSAS